MTKADKFAHVADPLCRRLLADPTTARPADLAASGLTVALCAMSDWTNAKIPEAVRDARTRYAMRFLKATKRGTGWHRSLKAFWNT